MKSRLNRKSGTNKTFLRIILLDKGTEPIWVMEIDEPFGKVTKELAKEST